jgi:hypothetical protein
VTGIHRPGRSIAKPGAVSDLGFFARNVPDQSGSSRVSEISYGGLRLGHVRNRMDSGHSRHWSCSTIPALPPGVVRHLHANGGIAEAFFSPERARTVDCENMRGMTAPQVDLAVGGFGS